MGAHLKDTGFFMYVLSVCVLCAASGNAQSCVVNGLQFLDIGVWYDRALYGVCIFQNGAVITLNVEVISFLCFFHLVEVSALRMLSVCFAIVMVSFVSCQNVIFGSKVIPKIQVVVVHWIK